MNAVIDYSVIFTNLHQDISRTYQLICDAYYRPLTKLREGNVFNNCLFIFLFTGGSHHTGPSGPAPFPCTGPRHHPLCTWWLAFSVHGPALAPSVQWPVPCLYMVLDSTVQGSDPSPPTCSNFFNLDLTLLGPLMFKLVHLEHVCSVAVWALGWN